MPGESDDTDEERVQRSARERQHERAEHVEDVLAETTFEEPEYPVRREDLAATYGDQRLDLPNETETLGDVFDRLVAEEFDSPEEVREAVYGELTGDAVGPREANEGRDLEAVEEGEDDLR